MTLANASTIFKMGSTMEAELVVADLTLKEGAVFCSNIMLELGFDESFGSVPL